jgi:hypothetical protein
MSDEWGEEEGFYEEDGLVDESADCDYGCTEFCEEPSTKDAGLCTTECQVYLCSVEAEADGGTGKWKCTGCGCTDSTPCSGGCHWVRKNFCSKCAQKEVIPASHCDPPIGQDEAP